MEVEKGMILYNIVNDALYKVKVMDNNFLDDEKNRIASLQYIDILGNLQAIRDIKSNVIAIKLNCINMEHMECKERGGFYITPEKAIQARMNYYKKRKDELKRELEQLRVSSARIVTLKAVGINSKKYRKEFV